MADTYSVNDHFVNKDPSVRNLYDRLTSLLRTFGPVEEDPKKTSIHLNRKSALAGVETRRNYLLLNIKSDHQIKSPRIEKAERRPRLQAIPGMVPDLLDLPRGCKFQARCTKVFDACRGDEPRLRPMGSADHLVRCCLY